MIGLLLLATVYVGTIGDLLEYGTPKAADVIVARKGYVVGFNDTTHCPDWTVHRLCAEQLNGTKVKRTDDFRHDAQVFCITQVRRGRSDAPPFRVCRKDPRRPPSAATSPRRTRRP